MYQKRTDISMAHDNDRNGLQQTVEDHWSSGARRSLRASNGQNVK